ncbi:hypothetical protein ACFU6I_01635 [Streptomyces sp. NPDC057486]|uniref:hypothetical protein n=1 Tax=Streptomyces sp. NPDC057486 TaxID=3346145 RepID=UPI0036B3F2B0
MAEVLLAGILGAVVLAAFLLHRAHRRNREITTLLRAEVAAQRIAAITLGRTAVLPADDAAEQPDPVRSKRHLALRIGGGPPALPPSFGDLARPVWRGHRAATMTVTAASVAVAGALVLTSGGGAPQTANAAPPATAPGPVPGAGQDEKGDSRDAERSPAEEGDGTAVTHDDSDARPFSGPRSAASGEGQSVASTEGEPSPGTSSTPASGDEDRAEPAEGNLAPSETAAPGPAGTAAPGPSASPTTTPPPPPTPGPTEEPTAPQKPDECDGLIDLHLPLLPDVCLL